MKLFLKSTKWKNMFLKCFSSFQNEETRFEAFFKFTKWRNTFLKRFSSLQNEETRFWSVFQVYIIFEWVDEGILVQIFEVRSILVWLL